MACMTLRWDRLNEEVQKYFIKQPGWAIQASIGRKGAELEGSTARLQICNPAKKN